MLRLLPLVFLCGCVTLHDPQPIDTKLDESKRDWIEIYRNEIRIAIENGDAGAYHFFMEELIKEKNRFLLKEIELWNEHEKKKSEGNPHPK